MRTSPVVLALALFLAVSARASGGLPAFDPANGPDSVKGRAVPIPGQRELGGLTVTGPIAKTATTQNGSPLPVSLYTFTTPPGPFASARDAAVFFVGFVRKNYPSHLSFEFCADILKAGGRFGILHFVESSSNAKCVNPVDTPQNSYAATIHTHPGNESNLALPSQIPSPSDYAYAAYRKTDQFLGGPAGQVLKFTKNDVKCRPASRTPSLIMIRSEEVSPPEGSTQGRYPFDTSWRAPPTPDEIRFAPYYCL